MHIENLTADRLGLVKMPHEFGNIINFRDVGKTVNEFLGRR